MKTAEERLEKFISRIRTSGKISGFNKKKILEFAESRKAHNSAANTIIKYLYPLYRMHDSNWIKKDFSKIAKDDIQEIVNKINCEKWSPKTKKNFIRGLGI